MEQKELLLGLVKNEIDQLKKRIEELKTIRRNLEAESGILRNGSKKRGPRPGSGTTRAASLIQLTFVESNKPLMSPSEIYEEAKKNGHDLKPAIIRQILSRSPNLFKSPKRGIWELKVSDKDIKMANSG